MLAVTLRGILSHKLRLLLSASAITLGIAFLAGTMVLTDTLRTSVDDLQTTLSGGSDVSVRSESATGSDVADRAPVPAELLTSLRQLPGVESATGSSRGYAQVLDSRGRLVGAGASVGTSMPPGGLLQVNRGRAPHGAGEVALDVDTANTAGLRVGDKVTLLTAGPPRPAVLVGLVAYGKVTSLPGASLVALDPAVAGRLLGTPGSFTTIDLTADDGVTPQQLRRTVAAELPAGLQAVTGQQAADESVRAVRKAVRFLPMALMMFVGVSLFVSAFLIVNTFSMLVSQRSREFGLLRAVGATSRQVFATVVGEALVVGAAASAAGFGLGVAAAHGMHRLLPALGVQLPSTPVTVHGSVAVVALAVGTTVTVLAALVPAFRAGQVTPMAALLGLSSRSRRTSRLVAILFGAVALTGLGIAAAGVARAGQPGLRQFGLGALIAVVGLAPLARHVVSPLVTVVGKPWARFLGVPGRLGCDYAVRNPARTVITSAALTVGLALVVLTSVFSSSATASLGRALDDGQRADYLVSSTQFSEFSPEVTAALAARPEFTAAAGVSTGSVTVGGKGTDLVAADPAALPKVLDLDLRAGSVADLGHGGVLVHRSVATQHHWRVGDTVALTFAKAGRQQAKVAGIFTEKRLLGTDYIIGSADYARWYSQSLDRLTLVTLAEGVSAAEAKSAFSAALRGHPELEARTKDQLREEQQRQLGQVLALVTGLLGLALVIALLGIVNTLALSVHERTREVGLLRAVGMSRSQMRRTIRYEAVLIGLIGSVLGVIIGLGTAASLVHILRDNGLTDLAVPGRQLALYVGLAVAAGVLAAALPARRATRLDVLAAIAHE
jgi:putative ABC transport system permease protein